MSQFRQADDESFNLDCTSAPMREPTTNQFSEATYHTIVETQTELICRFLPDGTLTFVNAAYCRHFGASAEQLIGQNFLDLLPNGEELLVQRYLEQLAALTPEQPILMQEHRVKTAEGEIRWQQWSNRAIFAADGQLVELQAVGRDITTRKRLEIELSRSNERFELAAAAVNCLIYDWDLERGTVERTRGLLSLIGYTPEEAGTELNWWSAQIHPDDLQSIEASFQTNLATAERFCYQYRVRHKQGHYIWVEDQGRIMRNAAGDPIRVVGSTMDITHRKETEETLQLQARVLESMGEGVVMSNEIGRIVFTNPTFDRMFGYERGELLGQPVTVLSDLPPDDANQLVNDCIKTLRTQGVWAGEVRNRRKDGTSFIAGVYISALYVAGRPYWVAVQQDITQRKQAETALRQSEERYRFLAESSSTLVASLDYSTTLTNLARLAVPFLADFCFFDRVATEGNLQRVAWHHRDPAEQAWFAQIQQFVPSLDWQNYPVVQALRSGKASFVPHVTESWLEAITTSREHLQFMQRCRPQSWITVPLLAQQRKLGTLTFCRTDCHYCESDLRLAEELARRAALALDNAQLYHQAQDANRIKDEFLAVLSHELRSPLNPILGWSKLLQLKHQDTNLLMRGLETIERNAKLQTQLIEDLLDVARILRGKLSLNIHPVDLKSTIEAAIETVQLAAEAKSIQISTRFEPAIGLVSGDSSRLQQVVWNLLSNAVKFTPTGGRIEVRLERYECSLREAQSSTVLEELKDPASNFQLNTQNLQNYAQITVTDTGKGINPEFLPYIFDYFRQADSSTTRNFGGLGLGLAIVRHIVELHGGTVQAASRGEDQGATFIVKLPLSQSSQGLKHRSATPMTTLDHQPLQDVSILVVDDEIDSQELTTLVLQQAGAVVLTAYSADQALDILSQSAIDILVSDIGMPEVDGYMMMRQIRALPETTGIPAIALTAYAGEFNRQKALAAGFQRHLAKPVDPDALIAAITTLIKEFGSVC